MSGARAAATDQAEGVIAAALADDPMALITELVAEQFKYAGLASFYNGVRYYIVDDNGVVSVEGESASSLPDGNWLAIAGHFRVLAVRAKGLTFNIDGQAITFANPERLLGDDATVRVAEKKDLYEIAPELDRVRYAHLWAPLALASKGMEALLEWLHRLVPGGWGVTIIVFAVTLKLALVPVGLWTVRLQRKVSAVQAELAPALAQIKSKYKGEEAHNRIIDAHKAAGVTPFFALKPLMTSLIQVPILVVVFNVLGEMSQLAGEGFLWIPDLAYPDVIATLPIWIPLFGDTLNLLPFVMTVVTIFSTIIYDNKVAPPSEVRRQKRSLYLMAAGFFLLFYPFPATMVLYWTLTNALQTIQQQFWRV